MQSTSELRAGRDYKLIYGRMSEDKKSAVVKESMCSPIGSLAKVSDLSLLRVMQTLCTCVCGQGEMPRRGSFGKFRPGTNGLDLHR
jgi:hypothetical protein